LWSKQGEANGDKARLDAMKSDALYMMGLKGNHLLRTAIAWSD